MRIVQDMDHIQVFTVYILEVLDPPGSITDQTHAAERAIHRFELHDVQPGVGTKFGHRLGTDQLHLTPDVLECGEVRQAVRCAAEVLRLCQCGEVRGSGGGG